MSRLEGLPCEFIIDEGALVYIVAYPAPELVAMIEAEVDFDGRFDPYVPGPCAEMCDTQDAAWLPELVGDCVWWRRIQ